MLEVHFLNVGHGDCTFIKFPSGRLAMIDVNNSRSLPAEDVEALAEKKGLALSDFRMVTFSEAGYRSWEDYYRSFLVDPYEYYRTEFPGSTIFRYIQTHPDMDHMSGLYRFFFEQKVAIQNFWDVTNTKALSKEELDSSRFDQRDWWAYQELRSGRSGSGMPHNVLHLLRGASSQYYSDDSISVWAPTAALIDACEILRSWNNASYVLRISYGGRTLILPGDAEGTAWDEICNTTGESNMRCDVLKAAHHGRESGYWERAVDAMDPEIVICSVGKKPETDASDEYAAQGAKVLSTRFYGTMKMQMWADGEVWLLDRNGVRIASLPSLRHG